MIRGNVAMVFISHNSKADPFVRKLADSPKAHIEGIFLGNLRLTDDNLCVNIARDCGIMSRHD